MTRNLYQLLGVSPDASPEAIHSAYRRLARRYHPDLNAGAGAGARFKEVSRAYEVLGDPDQRAVYDRAAATPSVRPARPPRPQPTSPPRPRSAPASRVPYFSDRVSTRDLPRFLDVHVGIRLGGVRFKFWF